jgi:hypothetical protein
LAVVDEYTSAWGWGDGQADAAGCSGNDCHAFFHDFTSSRLIVQL